MANEKRAVLDTLIAIFSQIVFGLDFQKAALLGLHTAMLVGLRRMTEVLPNAFWLSWALNSFEVIAESIHSVQKANDTVRMYLLDALMHRVWPPNSRSVGVALAVPRTSWSGRKEAKAVMGRGWWDLHFPVSSIKSTMKKIQKFLSSAVASLLLFVASSAFSEPFLQDQLIEEISGYSWRSNPADSLVKIKTLLQKGARIDVKASGWDPLAAAIYAGRPDVVDLIIEKKHDVGKPVYSDDITP